jgi:hypothetical protein
MTVHLPRAPRLVPYSNSCVLGVCTGYDPCQTMVQLRWEYILELGTQLVDSMQLVKPRLT